MLVFLMSTERSGSNFLTSVAGGLAGISAPPPTHLFRIFANNRINYGDLDNDANWKILIDDVVENFDAKLGVWQTSVDAEELLAAPRDVFELLRLIYEKEARADAATQSFVKENHTHLFAPFLSERFPDSRFVHLVRDPRDVASSWLQTGSIPGGVEEAVETWLDDQVGSLAVAVRLSSTGRLFRLRYEDLISRPKPYLTSLANFLDVPFDGSVFDYYKHPRTVANAQRITAWRNIERPIMRGNSGNYLESLSAADIRYVELRCHNLMREFGYISSEAVTHTEGVATELDRLRPALSRGRCVIDAPGEVAIRRRRLAAIKRVVERRLT